MPSRSRRRCAVSGRGCPRPSGTVPKRCSAGRGTSLASRWPEREPSRRTAPSPGTPSVPSPDDVAWVLTPRQLCDLELLLCGAFAPQRTFLGRADYETVCDRMRLASGQLCPVPVTLDLSEETLRAATRAGRPDRRLVLRDPV